MNCSYETARRRTALLGRGLLFVSVVALGMSANAARTQGQPSPELTQRWYRNFREAVSHLENGRCPQGKALAEETLRRYPASTVFREGLFDSGYYAHLLRGLVSLRCDLDKKLAFAEFKKELALGRIGSVPDWSSKINALLVEAREESNPPILTIDRIEPVAWRRHDSAPGTAVFEEYVIRLEATVYDETGVESVTIQGQQISIQGTGGGKGESRIKTEDISVRIVDGSGALAVATVDVYNNTRAENLTISLPALQLKNAASIHAIVVGIDDYGDAYKDAAGKCLDSVLESCGDKNDAKCYSLDRLSYAASDARSFADLLIARGVPKDNVHLFLSKDGRDNAKRHDILGALAAAREWEGSKLMFFFAGHGAYSRSEENLMIVSDTVGVDCMALAPGIEKTRIEDTSLSVAEVKRLLDKTQFPERYIFLDACRSARPTARGLEGEAPSGMKGGESADRKVSEVTTNDDADQRGVLPAAVPTAEGAVGTNVRRGIVTFYATQEQDISTESPRLGGGYFTQFLLVGLRRNLSLWELKSYVFDTVNTFSRREKCSADTGVAASECGQHPYLQLPHELERDIAEQRKTYVFGP